MKTIEVVAAVIYNERNKILVTKRKHQSFNGLWEFPGGKIEANESQQLALIREIKEELNVDIIVEDFIVTVNYDYEDFKLIMHVYKSRIIQGEIDLSVHSDIKWVNIKDLDELEWVPADVEVVKELKNI